MAYRSLVFACSLSLGTVASGCAGSPSSTGELPTERDDASSPEVVVVGETDPDSDFDAKVAAVRDASSPPPARPSDAAITTPRDAGSRDAAPSEPRDAAPSEPRDAAPSAPRDAGPSRPVEGPVDAGRPPDAGGATEPGPVVDAGRPPPDPEPPIDAGAPPPVVDAGVDVGPVVVDAGRRVGCLPGLYKGKFEGEISALLGAVRIDVSGDISIDVELGGSGDRLTIRTGVLQGTDTSEQKNPLFARIGGVLNCASGQLENGTITDGTYNRVDPIWGGPPTTTNFSGTANAVYSTDPPSAKGTFQVRNNIGTRTSMGTLQVALQ